ncbi:Rz1-like lysis system protein LysC [Kingella sp. (in: b-proteobacteria)]|uniref:Rz1-like lysis system protein LysC n=1 Tax=Kingella sp. (in: b-proteobacteria) TaxID=2020713 RepID=UPI0026DCCB65|nr:Rz1-like lysis system protein LysC [Kingella sp. (in: b-proteobacteria)]MDO4658337.1 Rz1-like lysis system protein LysC [Kingella sp. (in: b-proteobacteria)]
MKPSALIALLMLSACQSTPAPITPACPQVPECTRPSNPITTQGELVQAYQDTLTAFEQCRIARDTLAACLNPTEPAIKPNHVPTN